MKYMRNYIVYVCKNGVDLFHTEIEARAAQDAVYKAIINAGWNKKRIDIDRINKEDVIPLSYSYSGTARVITKKSTYFVIY